ncbi:DUF4259 domain-containing protein [Thiobacillus sp.]
MGAWGIGTFENDDAADWLDELQASEDSAVLQAALEKPENGEEYLEAPEGIHILCAGEIIAALQGSPTADLPDEARDWVQEHKSLDVSSLIPIATRKIDQVLDDGSELHELWQENEADYPAWRESVSALKARLSPT